MINTADTSVEWIHQGNRYAHAEDFRCAGCGRHASLSNMSPRYQEYGEPEPCNCWGGRS